MHRLSCWIHVQACIATTYHFLQAEKVWPCKATKSPRQRTVACTSPATHLKIIESVDSICRDGADTLFKPKKSNVLELPNTDVLSLFRHTICAPSASVHYNTQQHKIYSYSDRWKIKKMPIVHHLLLSSSVQMAYYETGVSNLSISFTKIIYTGVSIILDLHTFFQSRHTPGLQA